MSQSLPGLSLAPNSPVGPRAYFVNGIKEPLLIFSSTGYILLTESSRSASGGVYLCMPNLISPYCMLPFLQFEILAMLKNAKIRNNPKEIRSLIIRNLITSYTNQKEFQSGTKTVNERWPQSSNTSHSP